MINIKLDEKCVFTFDVLNLSIGIWQHRDGWLKGPIEGLIGEIRFSSLQQLGMFNEMTTYVVEDLKKIGKIGERGFKIGVKLKEQITETKNLGI